MEMLKSYVSYENEVFLIAIVAFLFCAAVVAGII